MGRARRLCGRARRRFIAPSGLPPACGLGARPGLGALIRAWPSRAAAAAPPNTLPIPCGHTTSVFIQPNRHTLPRASCHCHAPRVPTHCRRLRRAGPCLCRAQTSNRPRPAPFASASHQAARSQGSPCPHTAAFAKPYEGPICRAVMAAWRSGRWQSGTVATCQPTRIAPGLAPGLPLDWRACTRGAVGRPRLHPCPALPAKSGGCADKAPPAPQPQRA